MPLVHRLGLAIAASAIAGGALGAAMLAPGAAEAGPRVPLIQQSTCGVTAPNGSIYQTQDGRVTGMSFRLDRSRSTLGCFMTLTDGDPYFGQMSLDLAGPGTVYFFGRTAVWVAIFDFSF